MVFLRKALALFILLAVFSLSVQAVYLKAVEPVTKTLMANDMILAGKAGPGQTVVFIFERESDGCTTGTCLLGWDTVVPVKVPRGWTVEASPIHETPMKVKIKIAPDAQNGEYNITLAAVDEGSYDGLGNMSFSTVVNVTRDVFTISAAPTRVETGVGQPAVYYIRIANTGSASDPFEIKVREGDLPAWRFKKEVLVNYGTERVVPYEVVLNEESERTFHIQVSSLSSPLINKDIALTVNSKNSVPSDWKATTHGVMIFPIIEEPLYALMGLISNLF